MKSTILFSALLSSGALAAPTVVEAVEARAACSDMTIIFARGTTEPGTVGTLAGPPFFAAVKSQLGGRATLTTQGVDYPANIAGFLAGGDPAGSQTMANDVKAALAACPDTKLVMAGYSQGGQLVHNAAKLLGGTMSQVNSAVIFGDPDNGQPVAGLSAAQTKIICHAGDNICQGGALILAPHLTYGQDAGTAASFVIAAAGL
uniref:cutinase n=1 Tax=Sirococcus conigenus TaxID=83885 RepID=S4VCH4_9PEZI|nr:cutinase 1 [Sirococcus conigenus]